MLYIVISSLTTLIRKGGIRNNSKDKTKKLDI